MNKTGKTLRSGVLLTFSFGLLALASSTVTAHGGDGTWGHHMWDGGMWGGGWMWIWMILIPIMVILIPLAVIYLVVRKENDNGEDNAMTVLREQYARGDIDEDEFEKKRQKLNEN